MALVALGFPPQLEVEYDEGQDEEEKIELDNKLRLLCGESAGPGEESR